MKFNKTSSGKTAVRNYMGAKSYRQSAKEELVFSVVTSFMEDSYYEKKDKRIERVRALVQEVDPLFVAKLAIVTRREFHMRSAFHVLVGELAKCHKGDSLVRNTLRLGVERPDDLLEIVAYLGKPLPNAVKKGVAAALAKMDAYQLAKYKGDGKDVSLVDLFNLVHPKPPAEQAALWKQVIKGELGPANTWEARLTKAGQEAHNEEEKADFKREVWADLLGQKKLGYMAALRNARNVLKTGDKELVQQLCALISDPDAVRKSKQLPFRFLSAYQAVGDHKNAETGMRFESEHDLPLLKTVQDAILQAIEHSVANIPLLKGRTVILSDNSGSMRGDGGGASVISAMSKRTTADIANLFAVLYWRRAEDTLVGLFGDRLVLPTLNRNNDVFANFQHLNKAAERCGPATETGVFKAFEQMLAEKTVADRIIIFSDCQVGDGCQWYDTGARRGGDFNHLFQQYKRFNPGVLVYSVDLKGYGNTLFSDGVVTLAGWSDKIFEIMELVEKHEGLVKWIESYPVSLTV